MNFKKIIPFVVVIVLMVSVGSMLVFQKESPQPTAAEDHVSQAEAQLLDAEGNPVNFSDFDVMI